jgi:hypothetical protein
MLHRTRDDLMATMTVAEFRWWAAADEWGLVPDPIVQNAQLRSTIVNAAAGRSATTALDFLPRHMRPAATPAENLARFMAIGSAVKANLDAGRAPK